MLWSEDFDEFGIGEIEFRHLKSASEPGVERAVKEWYATPSLHDPIAAIIIPDIRRQLPILDEPEIAARAEEARADAMPRPPRGDAHGNFDVIEPTCSGLSATIRVATGAPRRARYGL